MILNLARLELFNTKFLNNLISLFDNKKSDGELLQIKRFLKTKALILFKFDDKITLSTSQPTGLDGADKPNINRVFYKNMNFIPALVSKIEELPQFATYKHEKSGLSFVKTSQITCLMIESDTKPDGFLKSELKHLESKTAFITSTQKTFTSLSDELKAKKETEKKAEKIKKEKALLRIKKKAEKEKKETAEKEKKETAEKVKETTNQKNNLTT